MMQPVEVVRVRSLAFGSVKGIVSTTYDLAILDRRKALAAVEGYVSSWSDVSGSSEVDRHNEDPIPIASSPTRTHLSANAIRLLGEVLERSDRKGNASLLPLPLPLPLPNQSSTTTTAGRGVIAAEHCVRRRQGTRQFTRGPRPEKDKTPKAARQLDLEDETRRRRVVTATRFRFPFLPNGTTASFTRLLHRRVPVLSCTVGPVLRSGVCRCLAVPARNNEDIAEFRDRTLPCIHCCSWRPTHRPRLLSRSVSARTNKNPTIKQNGPMDATLFSRYADGRSGAARLSRKKTARRWHLLVRRLRGRSRRASDGTINDVGQDGTINKDDGSRWQPTAGGSDSSMRSDASRR
jgi:hypothetical protein